MSRTCIAVLGVLAVAGMAFAGGDKVVWEKSFDKALQAAQRGGRPIAVYSKVTAAGGGC